MKKDFLWGASTSAYQVEGAWNEDGKELSVQDSNKTGLFANATDHYHHYQEDVKLMAEMGFKSYRFSISWARIISSNGKPNQKGIKFYHNLIDELLKYNIEPIITMFHFDLPLWIDKKGGWLNRELTINEFTKYAKVLFTEYGKKVKYWLTINEQNMMILVGHVIGTINPQTDNLFKNLYQMNHNMLLAQAKVFKLYHDLNLGGMIAPAPNISAIYPETDKPEDIDAAYKFEAVRNWLYLDMAVYGTYNKVVWNWLVKNNYQPKILDGDLEILKAGKPDFIAFNYYNTSTVKASTKNGEIVLTKGTDQQTQYDIPEMFDVVPNKNLLKTEFGWEIDPQGLLQTMRELNDRYHLPLMITENGLGAYDKLEKDCSIHDPYRINYLRVHIEICKKAINEGIELFSYNPWSAIDLVSTHEGVKKRYGFIYVNIDDDGNGDYKRYRKDSFYWYQKVIASNGEDLENATLIGCENLCIK